MKALLIGDSWAKKFLAKEIERLTGAEVGVEYNPGLTSSEIAQTVKALPFLDVVFIVAGVNDRLRHVGAARYEQGMIELFHQCWFRSFRIIALELPDINECEVPATIAQRCKRGLNRWWNDAGRRSVEAHYRIELRRRIEGTGYVELVRVDFEPGDWLNPSHINESGMKKLAAKFAATVK